jgi:serine/threonine protein kinase/tetratricopeptide (TPR) repeat protein
VQRKIRLRFSPFQVTVFQAEDYALPQENWDRIQELFLEAAELPPSQRHAFLDAACNGDNGVRQEVESLLQAEASGESAVETAIESEVAAMLEEDSLAGTRLGSYRLLTEIGHGGMGSVYLAERDDEQYRKLVAVKVVRRGMDTAQLLGRFRHERQILAELEHPYIARLIDGGSTPDGRPFLVMEHVEGQSIDTYCRENHLNLESRLRLFVRVCEAVSCAHRALVIHRDLKPSNILVTADGVPKLLDFGVAKLLSPSADPGATSTAFAMGPLTPAYASPEQVRGWPMTTAADVYALGAILFELLTEERAQKIDTYTPAEIERVVCHTEVPRPSSVAIAPSLARQLRGDLDNIVLMAMRKERERRYASVDQLAEDITRHLEGRPVRARQDSFGYRTQKFIRRHRLPITAVALIFISLIAGIVLAVTQARRAEAARQLAEAQKQVAERERTRAEAEASRAERERALAELETQVAKTEHARAERRLSDMVELSNRSLYDVHSAIEKLPGATEARSQIVATTLQFLQGLSKDAGNDDRLRFVLSVSYSKVASVQGFPTRPNLGDTKGALVNYKKSIDLIEPLMAKEPNRPEYILQWLGAQEESAYVMARTGERASAVSSLRATLPAVKRLSHLCPKDVHCLLAAGSVYSALVDILETSDLHAALEFAQLQTTSYESALKSLPEKSEIQLELASAYSQEAKILNGHGRLSDAVERYKRAIALRQEVLQHNPTDVLTRRNLMITYGNLGGSLGSPIYPNLGDAAGAREYYGKALAIARELANADPHNQLAQYDLAYALFFYASLDLPKEEWPASLALLREADGILQKVVAADPQSIAKLRPLSQVERYEGLRLLGLGDIPGAIAQDRLALATNEKGLARDPSDSMFLINSVSSESSLAEALAQQGDRTSSLEMARKAVAQAEKASTPVPDMAVRAMARAYKSLATVDATFGEWSEARTAAERSVAAYKQLIASGKGYAHPADLALVETLLQDCLAHSK